MQDCPGKFRQNYFPGTGKENSVDQILIVHTLAQPVSPFCAAGFADLTTVLLNNMKQNENNKTVCIEAVTKICASLSHEVNNSLAIINESAGLIEDLIGMSQHEYILQADHILPSTKSIAKQVLKTKQIMANLNHLAHSNDEVSGVLNLHEAVGYVGELLARPLLQNETGLNNECDQQLIIECNKLQLYSLLYLAIRRLVEGAGLEVITVQASIKANGETLISFKTKDSKDKDMEISDIKTLAEEIGGRIVFDKELYLTLPSGRSS